MSELLEHTRDLRSAIDDFMGRAQDRGLVNQVGAMGSLLVSGTLSERIHNESQLVLTPRVVAVASQRQLKERPFSAAVLGGGSLVSTLVVAAEVSRQEAIDRSRPREQGAMLLPPHFSILRESVEVAVPQHVEPLEAEFLFQRVTGQMALGSGSFRNELP